MSAASPGFSPQEAARALEGHVSGERRNVVYFPAPGAKRNDRSCTLTIDINAPDGFMVAGNRPNGVDGVELKDYARQRLGVLFKPQRQSNRGNGKAHRLAGGPVVRDQVEETGRTEGGGARRLHLLHFDDIKLSQRRRDLVRGLIPRVGLSLIWGPSGCGKSFLAFDLMMHVALGREYRGRRVEQGVVVFCALEGQRGFEARAEAWRQRHLGDSESVPFYVMPAALHLVSDHAALIALIKDELGAAAPAAVVIDTLNRSFEGSESSDQDMTHYVRAADAVREAFECAVIVVHHSGHEQSRPRGHTALVGAADAVIAVRKESAGQIIASITKIKDGEGEGDCIASRLDPVTVGTDEDGGSISSCVVVGVDVPVHQPSTFKLTKNQQTMLTILEKARHPLTTEQWNEAAKNAGFGCTRKADLYDARESLRSKGLIFEGMNGWSVKK